MARICRITPGFLNKKHLNFGQGLEFLKFGQGNRGPNQQNRRTTEEKIRKTMEINENSIRKFEIETLISEAELAPPPAGRQDTPL